MNKSIILTLIAALVVVLAFVAFMLFKDSPDMSDNGKHTWLEVCGSNNQCKQGVEKHYLTCVNSMSFEKPKNKSDLAEYLMLTNIEIEGCLSEKIGEIFPVE